jgi:hypothetical protein
MGLSSCESDLHTGMNGNLQDKLGTPPCTGVFYLFDTFRATAKVSSNNFHEGFWFESLGPEDGEWEVTGLDNFRYGGQLQD